MIKQLLKRLECWPYKQLVFRHFGFLTNEYGFVIEQDESVNICVFIASRENCILKIFVNPKETSVLIGPTGYAKQELVDNGYNPKTIDISLIVECFEPELKQIRNWGQPYSVILEWYAHYTKKHCETMLAGDFSQWPRIQKYLSERGMMNEAMMQELANTVKSKQNNLRNS